MAFHYTVTSNKSMDEALNTLEEQLKEHKFGILWQLDIPSKLQEKGVDSYTNPYRVLEVCNPQIASSVLNRNELVGNFLPCKITVYESEGKTKMGMPKPTTLMAMIEDEELSKIAQDVEDSLISALENSK